MGKNLSTFAIAEMLRVDPGSVVNWIDQGLLNAHRTPGRHRRVAEEDLLVFLRDHKMPVPKELDPSPSRVLIVDDEPGVTQLIARAIRKALPHVEIVEAHDGFGAGNVVATLKPQVVVLDLRMPGMDGFEVCRQIKAQDHSRHAEVIAVTAYPAPESEKKILECGARVCLNKPLDLGVLVGHIRAAL